MLKLRAFAGHAGGNVAVLFALALPLVIGGAAFGVETTYWYFKRAAMQAAVDASAYAAALEGRSGSTPEEVITVATLTAEQNGFDVDPGVISVTPTELNGGGQVEVILRDQAPRFFSAFFLEERVAFSTRAVATYNSAASACILALDPTAAAAAQFSGSSNLTLEGCSVMANSVASNAVNVQGSAKLSTECVISAGGVTATSGLTMSECETPIIDATPVADPYKNLPAPTPTGGCKPTPTNGTLNPGRYCGGLTAKGNLTFNPGVYYVEGDFTVNATASISGSGVTIYTTNGGHVKMNGSAHVDLAAPTSGIYSGVLFFGDRTVGGTNKFLGDASSSMTGAIYYAGGEVDYQGNFSGINGCTQVVARLVQWTGNATVGADCSALGMMAIPLLNLVRLTA